MSYMTLYKVPERGKIEEYVRFMNAYRGAYYIWVKMARRYLGWDDAPVTGDMQPIWDLARSAGVAWYDRIVLASTFDRVMVRRTNLPALIQAFESWRNVNSDRWPYQTEALKYLLTQDSVYAVCWQQTSVCDDVWYRNTGQVDEDGDPVWRLYDLSKDSGHWFLFDEIPLQEAASL